MTVKMLLAFYFLLNLSHFLSCLLNRRLICLVPGDAKTTSEISPTPGSTYPPVVKVSHSNNKSNIAILIYISEICHYSVPT